MAPRPCPAHVERAMTPPPSSSVPLAIALALAAILLPPRPALAALGEPASSITADRKALSAVSRGTKERAGYSVHELESGSVTVREYVSPSGTVFAIAWNGTAHPDLDTLLGSYAGEYHRAQRATPRQPGRHPRKVVGDRVVVERWGHMRNLRGRAYAPALLPDGVTPDEIQ